MPFRRNFDAELVANARGQSARVHQPAPITRSPNTPPPQRYVVCARQPHLLDRLLTLRCAIKPRGEDWHIEARSQEDLDAIVHLLTLNRVHGVLKRYRPGDHSGRREPAAP